MGLPRGPLERHAPRIHHERQARTPRNQGGRGARNRQDERQGRRRAFRLLHKKDDRRRRRRRGQSVQVRRDGLVGVRQPELDGEPRQALQKGKRLRHAKIRPDFCRRLRGRQGADGGVRLRPARADFEACDGKLLRQARRAHKGRGAAVRERARCGGVYERPDVRLQSLRYSAARDMAEFEAHKRGRRRAVRDGGSRQVVQCAERGALLRQGAYDVRVALAGRRKLDGLSGVPQRNFRHHSALGVQRDGVPLLHPPARRARPGLADGAVGVGHQPQDAVV